MDIEGLPLQHRATFGIVPAGGDARFEIRGDQVEAIARLWAIRHACRAGRLAHVRQPVCGVGGCDGDVMMVRRHRRVTGRVGLTA